MVNSTKNPRGLNYLTSSYLVTVPTWEMLLGRMCVLVDELSRVGDWLTVGSQRVLDEIEICVFERGSWRVEAYHADLHRDNVGEESLLDRCSSREFYANPSRVYPLG